MKNPPTTGELIKKHPISNSALSEIAVSLAAFSTLLRSEFGTSCGALLKQLEESVALLHADSKLSHATQNALIDCIQRLNERLDELEKLPKNGVPISGELSQTCTQLRSQLESFATQLTEAKSERASLLAEVSELKAKVVSGEQQAKESQEKVDLMQKEFNAMMREFNVMKRNYQSLCSELRRAEN